MREADVILHVRDIADEDSDAQRQDVETVLAQIGIGPDSQRKLIEVWNKSDLLTPDSRADVDARASRAGAAVASAISGEGTSALLTRIGALVDEDPERAFRLDVSDGEGLAWLYQHGRVTARNETEDLVTIVARLDRQALGRFEQLRPGATG